MGDATKLAFAVFLISCSSGGCGGGYPWLIVSCGEFSAMLIVTSAECNALLVVICGECGAMQCNPFFAPCMCGCALYMLQMSIVSTRCGLGGTSRAPSGEYQQKCVFFLS